MGAIDRNFVSNDNSGEQVREQFYGSTTVRNHINRIGIPTTVAMFRDLVASGSNLNLDSPEGSNLMETLSRVTFSKHPQQIHVMDKSSGKTIVSIPT